MGNGVRECCESATPRPESEARLLTHQDSKVCLAHLASIYILHMLQPGGVLRGETGSTWTGPPDPTADLLESKL